MRSETQGKRAGASEKIAVVLFAWRRAALTNRVLEAISIYKPTTFYVFIDGPQAESQTHEAQISEVLKLFNGLDWECDLRVVQSSINKGLRKSIISGLEQVMSEQNFALIFEDDCLPAPDFFAFADQASKKILHSGNFGILGGTYMGPKLRGFNSYSSFHYKIWGWGLSNRAWQAFVQDQEISLRPDYAHELIKRSSVGVLQRRFLMRQIRQREGNDTWALDFYLSQLRAGLLALYPTRNLVQNIGFGHDSTHTVLEAWWEEARLQSIDASFIKGGLKVAKSRMLLTELEFLTKLMIFWTWPLIHPIQFSQRVNKYLNRRRSS